MAKTVNKKKTAVPADVETPAVEVLDVEVKPEITALVQTNTTVVEKAAEKLRTALTIPVIWLNEIKQELAKLPEKDKLTLQDAESVKKVYNATRTQRIALESSRKMVKSPFYKMGVNIDEYALEQKQLIDPLEIESKGKYDKIIELENAETARLKKIKDDLIELRIKKMAETGAVYTPGLNNENSYYLLAFVPEGSDQEKSVRITRAVLEDSDDNTFGLLHSGFVAMADEIKTEKEKRDAVAKRINDREAGLRELGLTYNSEEGRWYNGDEFVTRGALTGASDEDWKVFFDGLTETVLDAKGQLRQNEMVEAGAEAMLDENGPFLRAPDVQIYYLNLRAMSNAEYEALISKTRKNVLAELRAKQPKDNPVISAPPSYTTPPGAAVSQKTAMSGSFVGNSSVTSKQPVNQNDDDKQHQTNRVEDYARITMVIDHYKRDKIFYFPTDENQKPAGDLVQITSDGFKTKTERERFIDLKYYIQQLCDTYLNIINREYEDLKQ